MEEFGAWFQNVAGNVISAATAAKYTQPYQLQMEQLKAMQSGGWAALSAQPAAGGTVSMSPLLLIGGAVLLFVLLKD